MQFKHISKADRNRSKSRTPADDPARFSRDTLKRSFPGIFPRRAFPSRAAKNRPVSGRTPRGADVLCEFPALAKVENDRFSAIDRIFRELVPWRSPVISEDGQRRLWSVVVFRDFPRTSDGLGKCVFWSLRLCDECVFGSLRIFRYGLCCSDIWKGKIFVVCECGFFFKYCFEIIIDFKLYKLVELYID